jgi:hypothetical protein
VWNMGDMSPLGARVTCSHVTPKKPKGVAEPAPNPLGVAYHPTFGSLGVANHPPNGQGGGYVTRVDFFIGADMAFR